MPEAHPLVSMEIRFSDVWMEFNSCPVVPITSTLNNSPALLLNWIDDPEAAGFG